jgi:hypothetical protein
LEKKAIFLAEKAALLKTLDAVVCFACHSIQLVWVQIFVACICLAISLRSGCNILFAFGFVMTALAIAADSSLSRGISQLKWGSR